LAQIDSWGQHGDSHRKGYFTSTRTEFWWKPCMMHAPSHAWKSIFFHFKTFGWRTEMFVLTAILHINQFRSNGFSNSFFESTFGTKTGANPTFDLELQRQYAL
jgi:hypothetical protein